MTTGITARELARQKRQARKERERDAREADRARLKALRANIANARAHGRDRVREVRVMCRDGRVQAREMAKAIRARKRAEAIAEIAEARAQSRGTCEANKVAARTRSADSLQRAAAALQAEREHQRTLQLWARPPKLAGPKKRRSGRAAELAAESDDEVIGNLPPELVPVFRAKRGKFKATARRTRTEAFLEWAQSHPAEVLEVIDAQLQRDVAKLIAEEKRLRREVVQPSTYSRASESELLKRYQAYTGAPDVPF